jgi:radical SAM protein with 4Fe4S-binding SPASM domain
VCVIVLTRLNAARIVQTLEFLAASGARRVMLNRFNLGGAGIQKRSSLLLAAHELRDAYLAADQAASRLSLSVSANVGTPWCIIDPRHYPHITMSSCGRVPEGMPLTLGADGSLRLCNHSPVILGNIHRSRFDVLLKEKTASAFLSATPTLCTTCGLYEDCRGGCRAVSQQLSIPLESHDPISSTVSAAAT